MIEMTLLSVRGVRYDKSCMSTTRHEVSFWQATPIR